MLGFKVVHAFFLIFIYLQKKVITNMCSFNYLKQFSTFAAG